MFDHEYWMKKAFVLAEQAYHKNEVPVGAIIVKDNLVVGKGFNQIECLNDATAHAEMIALTSAANYFKNWRLEGCKAYVTLEPCLMCAGAFLNSRISTVIFSAYDLREGAGGSKYSVFGDFRRWQIEVIPGVLKEQGEAVLKKFFKNVRNNKKDKNPMNSGDASS